METKQIFKVNMNDFVRVKLTNKGKMHLLEKHYQLCKECGHYLKPPTIGDNGEYECQLHQLFQDFGDLVWLGGDVPFDVNFEIIKQRI